MKVFWQENATGKKIEKSTIGLHEKSNVQMKMSFKIH